MLDEHPNFIDGIVSRASGEWKTSYVTTNVMGADPAPSISNARISTQQPLSKDENGSPLSDILFHVEKMNYSSWNFKLTGTDDQIDATEIYKYEVGGHFRWHMDMTPILSSRKLGFTLQLSASDDYEGGDLEFMACDSNPAIRKKGSLIVFPSFVWHQITPVTQGTRLAIVGWVHGPTFQ